MSTKLARFAVALASLVVLVGCGPTGTAGDVPPTLTTPASPAPAITGEVVPTAIRISSIKASGTDFVPLGLDDKGEIEVPDVHTPQVAGWWTGGAVPGDVGTAAVVAHVDGGGKHGLFFNLSKVKVGDFVSVDRSDGTTATFTVTKVAKLDKLKFPTKEFYSKSAQPTLNLATCGGRYDAAHKRYLDSILVYAKITARGPTH